MCTCTRMCVNTCTLGLHSTICVCTCQSTYVGVIAAYACRRVCSNDASRCGKSRSGEKDAPTPPHLNLRMALPMHVATALRQLLAQYESEMTTADAENIKARERAEPLMASASNPFGAIDLRDVWKYIGKAVVEFGQDSVMEAFGDLPIVPTMDGRLFCLDAKIYACRVLALDTTSAIMNTHLVSCLKKLGCTSIDWRHAAVDAQIVGKSGFLLKAPTAAMMLDAIEAICNEHVGDPSTLFGTVSADERMYLFKMLDAPGVVTSEEHVRLVATLPIVRIFPHAAVDGVASTRIPSVDEVRGKGHFDVHCTQHYQNSSLAA